MIAYYDGGESGRILVPEAGLPVLPVSRNNVSMKGGKGGGQAVGNF